MIRLGWWEIVCRFSISCFSSCVVLSRWFDIIVRLWCSVFGWVVEGCVLLNMWDVLGVVFGWVGVVVFSWLNRNLCLGSYVS